jgi:hypothetical protein
VFSDILKYYSIYYKGMIIEEGNWFAYKDMIDMIASRI